MLTALYFVYCCQLVALMLAVCIVHVAQHVINICVVEEKESVCDNVRTCLHVVHLKHNK